MPEVGEYKGKPVPNMNPGEWPAFSFGVLKAELILLHLDDIVQFVRDHGDSTVVSEFMSCWKKV